MKELSVEKDLKSICGSTIYLIESVLDIIDKQGLENEQFVLDWLDKLNELSVRY